MSLLAEDPALDLYNSDWVVHTRSLERAPVKMGPNAQVGATYSRMVVASMERYSGQFYRRESMLPKGGGSRQCSITRYGDRI